MSLFTFNIHFHDGELAKLAAYLVDGSLAAAQCVIKKGTMAGDYEKARRCHEKAIQNMALMMKFLTPAQKEAIAAALEGYVTCHLFLFVYNILTACRTNQRQGFPNCVVRRK